MKKAWLAMLGAGALLATVVSWTGVALASRGTEPVITQQLKCVVLAKTNREMVVQNTESVRTELRTVRFVKNAQSEAVSFVSDTVEVGDFVQLETEIYCDNTETLRTVEVLTACFITPQQAAQLLQSAVQLPEITAFTPQEAVAVDELPTESAVQDADA